MVKPLEQIRQKYRHLGLRSVLRTKPSSVALYGLLHYLIGVVDRDVLRKMSADQDTLWVYGGREVIEIGGSSDQRIPDPFKPISGTYEIDQPFVCELQSCRLLGTPAPMGLTADGRVILETTRANEIEAMQRLRNVIASNGWSSIISDLLRKSATGAAEDTQMDIVFPSVRPPEFSYYHWISEYLPKIEALERYEEQTGRRPVVLIEAEPPDWIIESLELVGISPERLVEWNGRPSIIDRLVIGTHREKSRGDFFHPSTADYHWVRDRVLANIEDQEFERLEKSNRIYISRRHAGRRRVVNEEAVMDVLGPMGFDLYVLEDLSVGAQASLFSQADYVISPHGAGLANLIFGEDSLYLIELQNTNHLDPGPHLAYYYYAITNQLGFDYSYLACEPIGEDMRVDVEELENRVRGVIG